MYRLGASKLSSNLYRKEALRRSIRCFSTGSESCSTHTSDHGGKAPSSDDPQHYDIAIVGGGMVGMALASSLSHNPLTQKLNIAIIDGSPVLRNGICIKDNEPPDQRVSAITPSSISLLKAVGAWRIVEQHRHAYFSKMQVWDYTGLGYTRYNAKDANKDILGCVVENKLLHSSLLACLQEIDYQKTLLNSRLTSMTLPSGASKSATGHSHLAHLELDDGTTLVTKLVVGADGGKSHVRQLAGFDTMGWKYPQNALICTVEHSEHNSCAWQRFLPNGPIALLPMGDNYSNIVWSMSPEESSERKTMNSDDFVKAVNDALDYGYGPRPQSNGHVNDLFSWMTSVAMSPNEPFEVPPKVTKLVSERMVFPLSLMHSKSYASNRVVLIGDAAHTVHPLAGQGVNLGFGDASALAKVISEGIALGSDFGEVSILKKYEADRRPVNAMMASVLDGFQKAYSVDFGPLNVLRAAALQGAHHLSPLKKNIIKYASGEMRLPFFS